MIDFLPLKESNFLGGYYHRLSQNQVENESFLVLKIKDKRIFLVKKSCGLRFINLGQNDKFVYMIGCMAPNTIRLLQIELVF